MEKEKNESKVMAVYLDKDLVMQLNKFCLKSKAKKALVVRTALQDFFSKEKNA